MPSTWTDPTTTPWSAGHLVTAAELNTHMRDNFLHLGGTTGHIGAHVYHSADQSIANTTTTYLAFNSERFDTDPNGAIHDPATNNSRLTCRTAGKYLVWASVTWAAAATGQRNIQLQVNRTTTYAVIAEISAGAGTGNAQTIAAVIELAANDYVELAVYQDSGGAVNVSAVSAYSPNFGMAKC